jgi:hypothetical protein
MRTLQPSSKSCTLTIPLVLPLRTTTRSCSNEYIFDHYLFIVLLSLQRPSSPLKFSPMVAPLYPKASSSPTSTSPQSSVPAPCILLSSHLLIIGWKPLLVVVELQLPFLLHPIPPIASSHELFIIKGPCLATRNSFQPILSCS